MTNTKIFIFGAKGRMGQEVASEIQARRAQGQELQWVSKLEDKPDIIIDFSSSAGAVEAAQWCAANKTPLVTGSTGLSAGDLEEVKKCSKTVATLQSPNMSLGVNALAESISNFSKHFKSGEIAIEEFHHKHKKDKPSGTAQFFHDVVKKIASQFTISEPVSVRGGEIFGIHKIFFFIQGEWVAFEHHATDRSVFARGAVAAALWTVKQKAGLYSMQDFLGQDLLDKRPVK